MTAMDDSKKRTRSRDGCLTCRKRKKRCDEGKPSCNACIRLQLECEYPIPGQERKNKKQRSKPPQVTQIKDPSSTESSDVLPPDDHWDILSPLFKFEDVMPGDQVFTAMPDFSLPSELVFDEPSSTPSMLARLQQKYPELEQHSIQLFTYFCDTQSQLMSVSPQNNFKHVFAQMAVSNEPVLYALLSWAAFHNAVAEKADYEDNLGRMFLTKAIVLMKNPYTYEFSVALAALMLIASSCICSGDIQNWRQHLETAANLIKRQGVCGINFKSEKQYWLLKNFAYHDILAFGNRKKPLLLPKELHSHILNYKSDYLPDTLCACCQPVFLILASINDFCREIHEENVGIVQIQQKADELLLHLNNVSPDNELLLPLSYMDAREQLNLFKLFQQLARVVVHNLLLRLNAASIPMQVMNSALMEITATVVGTRLEAALVFPLFIAGITCSSQTGRQQVVKWLDIAYENHSARNISRAKALMREVWARDENGTKHVDWNHIAEIKGWNLCFA